MSILPEKRFPIALPIVQIFQDHVLIVHSKVWTRFVELVNRFAWQSRKSVQHFTFPVAASSCDFVEIRVLRFDICIRANKLEEPFRFLSRFFH